MKRMDLRDCLQSTLVVTRGGAIGKQSQRSELGDYIKHRRTLIVCVCHNSLPPPVYPKDRFENRLDGSLRSEKMSNRPWTVTKDFPRNQGPMTEVRFEPEISGSVIGHFRSFGPDFQTLSLMQIWEVTRMQASLPLAMSSRWARVPSLEIQAADHHCSLHHRVRVHCCCCSRC